MKNYKKSYSILGVFQDDDWETVRNAYKRQIRRWHPDRFQDPDQRKIAEDKCKEINLAYQTLDDYYRQAGALPPEDSPKHETPSPMDTTEYGDVRPPASVSVGIDPYQDTFASARKPTGRSYTTILIVVIAVAIGYVVSEPLLTEHPNTPEIALPEFVEPKSATNTSAILHSADSHDNTQIAHGEWEQNGSEATHEPASGTISGSLPYITRGSTKQEVLAIQGRPLRETDTAWDYGLSRINFQNGKVVDWYENPMNPLIVQR